eukprot:NODE_1717_length_2395_cov_6.532187.p1 GENE.NODE_1717_length_2395_cov_6.532187~~NODE_1717_length_2395_cov_6.532187.p1  ORF type:complete len:747 (-),score=136.19 NODE_1717_length_2395_cov_6.532187:154-2133(-)
MLMSRSAAVECHNPAHVVFWLSIITAIMWAIGVPIFLSLSIPKEMSSDTKPTHEVQMHYQMMCKGYTHKMRHWELAVFATKLLATCISHANGNKAVRATFSLMFSMLYAGLYHHFEPLERRGGSPFQVCQTWFLVAWFSLSCITMMILECPHVLQIVTIPVFIAVHLAYLIFCARHFFVIARQIRGQKLLREAATSGKVDVSRSARGLTDKLDKWILFRAREEEHCAPYIAMDPLHSVVVMCGNRGDKAEPPKFPRGVNYHNGRPPLSKANPINWLKKHGIKSATESHIKALMESITQAMEYVNQSKRTPTFSISLVEFVLRAVFVLARTKEAQNHGRKRDEETLEEEDSQSAISVLLQETDLPSPEILVEPSSPTGMVKTLSCRSVKVEVEVFDDATLEVKNHFLKTFPRVLTPFQQPEVQEPDELIYEVGAAHCDMGFPLEEEVPCVEVVGVDGDEVEVNPQGSSVARDPEFTQWGLQNKVQAMFDPENYKRGVTLQAFQEALFDLESIAGSVIADWLDLFETGWIEHNERSRFQLHQCLHRVEDTDTQTDRWRTQRRATNYVAPTLNAIIQVGKPRSQQTRTPGSVLRLMRYKWAFMVMRMLQVDTHRRVFEALKVKMARCQLCAHTPRPLAALGRGDEVDLDALGRRVGRTLIMR